MTLETWLAGPEQVMLDLWDVVAISPVTVATAVAIVIRPEPMTSHASSLVFGIAAGMRAPGIGFTDYEHLGYRTRRQGCQEFMEWLLACLKRLREHAWDFSSLVLLVVVPVYARNHSTLLLSLFSYVSRI